MSQILLMLHISTGAIGILTGFLSLMLAKGSQIHIVNGRLFSIAMLVSGCAIVGLGVYGDDINDIFSGLTILYFTVSGWRTLQLANRTTNALDLALFISVIGIFIVNLILGLKAKSWSLEYPPAQYFVVAAIHLMAVADDTVLLIRKKAEGTYRLIRHSWRMCLVLFMASGSFFLGQMDVFPGVLIEKVFFLFFLPPLLPLLYLGYWMLRLLVGRAGPKLL